MRILQEMLLSHILTIGIVEYYEDVLFYNFFLMACSNCVLIQNVSTNLKQDKRSTFRFKVTVLLGIIFVHFSSLYFIRCIRKERKNLFYENVYCFIYVWARSLTRWKHKFNTIRVFRIRVKFYNIARLMHIRHDNWCVKWTKRIT